MPHEAPGSPVSEHRAPSIAEESSPSFLTTGTLRPGYRVFHLRSPLGTRLEACCLFVHISAGVEPNSWVSGMAIQKQLEESEARIRRLEAQMKTQVARQFSLMVKQLKLTGGRDGATAAREHSSCATSDLDQSTTNPGLVENRASSDARASSSSRSSEAASDTAVNVRSRLAQLPGRAACNLEARFEGANPERLLKARASLPNHSDQAAADAAADDAPDPDGSHESHWPHVRESFCSHASRRAPPAGLPPGASTREQALARSRNAPGRMQQVVGGIDTAATAATAAITSAYQSADAGLGASHSPEMCMRGKASVGHARVSDSPTPKSVFTGGARAAARGRQELDTLSEAFSKPFTGLAQAFHRPAGALTAAAGALAPAASALQLPGLSLQHTVGCRAAAPAAATHTPSLKTVGQAAMAVQRMGAQRSSPPQGWPPMQGAPAVDESAARDAARSWLSKLEGDLLARNSM